MLCIRGKETLGCSDKTTDSRQHSFLQHNEILYIYSLCLLTGEDVSLLCEMIFFSFPFFGFLHEAFHCEEGEEGVVLGVFKASRS